MIPKESPNQVDNIREQSRLMVRELGFMGKSLAATDLPPSAVHTILEVGCGHAQTASDLCQSLLLEKSTVSRLVASLLKSGLLRKHPSPTDKRKKLLFLSANGRDLLQKIDGFGRTQVVKALEKTGPNAAILIERGLATYAAALQHARLGTDSAATDRIEIQSGYTAGLLGKIIQMHAEYYSHKVAFGVEFEMLVASDMAEFFARIDHPKNATWHANLNGQIIIGLSFDGQDLGPGIGHLRWFIADSTVRGAGLGNRLMDKAMAFTHEQDFSEVHLWTFDGLPAARALYEKHGFILSEQRLGATWGTEVLEQKFIWKR